MKQKLTITADREDYAIGLTGKLDANGFSGFGEGWYNNSDVQSFCASLHSLSESMEGNATLLGTQSKSDGSEFLERLCIRVYPLAQSKLNGVIGVHISLSDYPYTDCRQEEISKVSSELKVRNHNIKLFADSLYKLLSGETEEACLIGEDLT